MTKQELQNQATALGIDIDRRWGEERLREEIGRIQASNFAIEGDDIHDPEITETTLTEAVVNLAGEGSIDLGQAKIDYMNSRVQAIWEGQSVTLPLHERKRRITKAMIDKGFEDIIEQIKWPD